jgi:TPR repeat protein
MDTNILEQKVLSAALVLLGLTLLSFTTEARISVSNLEKLRIYQDMYFGSNGQPKQPSLALEKIRELADATGDPEPMIFFGEFAADKAQALNYIKKAADSGLVKAQWYLGEIYRTPNNQFIKTDVQEAIKWLELAANSLRSPYSSTYLDYGAHALFRLALIYQAGEGVTQNEETSEKYFSELVKRYDGEYIHPAKIEEQKEFFDDRIVLAGYMIDVVIASYRGSPVAQSSLAGFYQYGIGEQISGDSIGQFEFKTSATSALYWANESLSKDYPKSADMLATMHMHGITDYQDNNNKDTIEQDNQKAVNFLIYGARIGCEECVELLGERNKFKITDWNFDFKSARTNYRDYNLYYTWHFAEVGYSKSGNKHVYFNVSSQNSDMCTSSISRQQVWEFNGQPVRMSTWCIEREGSSKKLKATASTKKGGDYIVGQFKKSSNPVMISSVVGDFEISANGFTKVWGGASRPAL